MDADRIARRLGATLCAFAAGLLIWAPSAHASDTFVLDNQSKVASLSGYSLWGKGNTMSPKCRTGPFPGPTETQFTFNPGDRGSITLSEDPFSSCLSGINPLVDNQITSPDLTQGVWTWIPYDPAIGYASLVCIVTEQVGTQPIEATVDGLTCTITDGDATPSGSFTASAAPVRGGTATVLLQHFPGSAAGSPAGSTSSARYELVLRDPKGGVHGKVRKVIVSGDARKVKVPISRALRMEIADKGFTKVKAVLRRVDGQPGSGDRTVLRVTKDRKSLPL